MKFTITINPKYHPNEIGEILRAKFFNMEKGFGCYSSFELNAGVVKLPDEIEESNDDGKDDYDALEKYTCAEMSLNESFEAFPSTMKIKMRYSWSTGDGSLEFIFPDGSILCNYDCKKNYGWEYYE